MALTDLTRRDWPPASQERIWQHVSYLAALRQGDEMTMRAAARSRQMGADARKPYIVSPLPGLITRVVADMLYGEEPRFIAANDSDQEALADLVNANGLAAELLRAAAISISEGEVWGRVIADPELAPYPIIDFHSRAAVMPVFRGRFLMEATLISEFAGDKDGEVFRLLETHRAGEIESHLYKGNRDKLGKEVPLESRPETAAVPMMVTTGIDRPLVVRIANKIDADPTLGVSDLEPLVPLFLSVYEAMTTTQHNLRLVGAKRLMVERDALDKKGNLNLGDDVFVYSQGGASTLGQSGSPFQQLEYDFDAGQLIAWLDWLIDHTLTAGGVSPASVGRGDLGGSLSGTALKLRMAHTLTEVSARGRQFDAGVAELLRMAQLIDAAPAQAGGFGRSWAEPDTHPVIMRGDGLPRDDKEEAQTTAVLASAGAISTEEAVRRTHPTWDDARVADEVAKIDAGASAMNLFPTGP